MASYSLKKDIKAKLQKIYSVRVHDSSKETVELAEKQKGEKVYGEATWSGVNQMIRHFRPLTEDDVFLDIGSGRGKMVLHMALQTPVKKCIGVELVTPRHEDAIKLKEQIGDIPDKEVIFINEDIFKTDTIQQATIIYANVIMWDETLVQKIIENMSEGSAIYFNKLVYDTTNRYLTDESLELDMSWKKGSTYQFYKKNGNIEFKQGEQAVSDLVNKAWPEIEKIIETSPQISEAVAEILADQCFKGILDPTDKEKLKEETVKIVLAMLKQHENKKDKK